MTSVASGDFLREFTLFADRAHENKESFVVQRENGKHLVVMSMESYNDMKKELYLEKKKSARKSDG